jgi:hypothetical protein
MKTTHLLFPVGLVLGVLVWLDNSGTDDTSGTTVVQPVDRSGHTAATTDDTRPALRRGDLATATVTTIGNPLAVVDKERLRATVDRPLFAPSRSRPPVAVKREEVAAAPPPPPSFALLGVVTDGGRTIALLRRVADGTSFRVEVGDTIGGWQVASVEANSIRLQRPDGTSRTVPLSEVPSKTGPNGPE